MIISAFTEKVFELFINKLLNVYKIINLFECKNSIPENYLKLYFK